MEVWKDVEGYEGLYQISNMGQLRHLGCQRYPGVRIIKPVITEWGYEKWALSKHRERSFRLIHRLVAAAFIPNPLNKLEVNHINGIKTDNRAENLEWATRKENQVHAYRTGLAKGRNHGNYLRGKNNPRSRSVVALDEDGNFVKRYDSGRDADRDLGVSCGIVCNILSGRKKRAKGLTFKYESDYNKSLTV